MVALGLAIGEGAGLLVLVSCETDFVSGNDQFKTFVNDVAEAGLAAGADSAESLAAAPMNGETVQDQLTQMIGRLGENMNWLLLSVSRLMPLLVTTTAVALLPWLAEPVRLKRCVRSPCVAAANPAPMSLDREGVPADILDKEREIIAASDEIQSKPEQIRPKIVEGKLNRFFKERVLLEQELLVGGDGEAVGMAQGQRSGHQRLPSHRRLIAFSINASLNTLGVRAEGVCVCGYTSTRW